MAIFYPRWQATTADAWKISRHKKTQLSCWAGNDGPEPTPTKHGWEQDGRHLAGTLVIGTGNVMLLNEAYAYDDEGNVVWKSQTPQAVKNWITDKAITKDTAFSCCATVRSRLLRVSDMTEQDFLAQGMTKTTQGWHIEGHNTPGTYSDDPFSLYRDYLDRTQTNYRTSSQNCWSEVLDIEWMRWTTPAQYDPRSEGIDHPDPSQYFVHLRKRPKGHWLQNAALMPMFALCPGMVVVGGFSGLGVYSIEPMTVIRTFHRRVIFDRIGPAFKHTDNLVFARQAQ